MKRFSDFALAPKVVEALTAMGLESPTAIQDGCIPHILSGKDVVGKAETGTGKTVGFGAPLVGSIDCDRVSVQALVLTPTRELAQQVAGVLEELGREMKLGVALVVGGVHASEQILKLRSGTQIVVGTPGRVLEFVRDRILQLSYCDIVVLDEADRMLDMGFIEDVSAIIEKTPEERQTLLFSATLPREIQKLLKRYMKTPEIISTSSGLTTVPEIEQNYVEADFHSKFKELRKILDGREGDTIVIFCNTRRQAIDLDRMLWGHGYSASSLHGDQDQDARFKVLELFRGGDVKVLVATDVASRGLDIDGVRCVINYEIPGDSESYVHRIGRTGRAQQKGAAVSFVSSREWEDWQRIVRETGFEISRLGPERISKRGGRGRRGGERGGRGPDGGGSGRPRRERGGRGRRGGTSQRGRFEERGESTMAEHEDDKREPSEEREASARGAGEKSAGAGEQSAGIGEQSAGAGEQSAGAGEQSAGAGEKSAGEKSASDGESGGRGRTRRRRGRRGRDRDGEGRGGEAAGESRGEGAPPRRGRDRDRGGEGRGREGAPRRGRDRDAPTSGGAPAADSFGAGLAAPSERPRPKAPERKKLEELDDDFLRTNYFDVDDTLIRRGADSAPAPREGEGEGEGRGRSRRRGGRRRRGGQEGQGGAPARTERPRTERREGGGEGEAGAAGAAREGDSRPEQSGDAPEKRRRRRRRRRRPREDGEGQARKAGPTEPDSSGSEPPPAE